MVFAMLGTAMIPLKVSKDFWILSVCLRNAASETTRARGAEGAAEAADGVAGELIIKIWGLQNKYKRRVSFMNQRMRRKISSDEMEIEAVPLTAKNNTFAKIGKMETMWNR